MTKRILLLPLALGLGLTLTGCETVSDVATGAADATSSAVDSVASALDPSGWFGSDDTTQTADNGASSDSAASTTPDLANLPSRPATTPPSAQQATAQSLAADGAQARYSADALRAGTEAAAPPPGAADAPPPSARVALAAPSASDAPPTTDMAPPTASAPPTAQPAAPPPPAARPAPPPVAAAAPPPSALTQGTAAVAVPGGAPMAAPAARAPAPAAAVAAAAPAARAPGAQPAVPAVPPNTARGAAMGGQVATDAQLGFKPSSAPPLDASVAQWVSPPVMQRYRQTASSAGVAPVRMPAVPPKGGTPDMSGAVSANLDSVSAPGAMAMSGGATPTAVVYFPGDGTTLSAAARTQVRAAVNQFKAMGGTGTVHVVGHASSRTANMPVEKHLETIFKKSQDRANAVAQELIHQGVPATKVLIDAVGDSQPVYYESMPQGEEGNRRAEIFVQG